MSSRIFGSCLVLCVLLNLLMNYNLDTKTSNQTRKIEEFHLCNLKLDWSTKKIEAIKIWDVSSA